MILPVLSTHSANLIASVVANYNALHHLAVGQTIADRFTACHSRNISARLRWFAESHLAD
jgi:hypothetical protein